MAFIYFFNLGNKGAITPLLTTAFLPHPLCHPTQFLYTVLKDISGLPQTYREFSLPSTTPIPDALSLSRVVRALYTDALSRGTPGAKFSEKLVKLGVSVDTVDALAAVLYNERRGEFLATALARVGVQLGGRALVSWDWSVKHVLSSSKVAALGESALTLTLTVGPVAGCGGVVTAVGQQQQQQPQAQGGDGNETFTVELSPKEAQALLDSMEAAKAASLCI